MRPYSRRLVFLLVFVFLTLSSFAQQTAPPADLDAWVVRSMKQFDVPGLSIAIVKDGKVVLTKGYGVRKLGSPEPVDANTLFGIASNTKAFTSAALAMLVDEGKISWDDPVQKHLPGFQLYDPFVTREVMIRDLLSHRAGLGLGAGDLLFWPDTDVTREQVLNAVRWIKPATTLRSRYAYNNLMFLVAGQIIPAKTGKTWDEFIRERIFTPLGMNSSTITSIGFKPGDNIAYPHSRGWRLEGPLAPIHFTKDETWAAAAGIKSSANDLAKWAILQLDHGKLPDGKRLFSEAAQHEMWSPQIMNRTSEPKGLMKPLKSNFSGYGLGWALKDYRGHKIVSHGGALTGMVSTVFLVPDENLGIVVLTNQEESGAFSAIVYHIVDHYLGAPENDWIQGFYDQRQQSMKRAADAEKLQDAARNARSQPSLPLAQYAGEYEDPWYGKARITAENGKLVLQMTRTPLMVGELSHWQYNTFKAVFRDNTIPDAFVTFAMKADGTISEMTMIPTSSLADFSFDYQDLDFHPVPKPATNAGSK